MVMFMYISSLFLFEIMLFFLKIEICCHEKTPKGSTAESTENQGAGVFHRADCVGQGAGLAAAGAEQAAGLWPGPGPVYSWVWIPQNQALFCECRVSANARGL